LREAIAERNGLQPSQVLIGNGSDEVLRLLCHAFLDPQVSEGVGMLYPTYSLYVTLAEMFGAGCTMFDVEAPDYEIPSAAIEADVKLFFVANPNPPLGTLYSMEVLKQMAVARSGRLLVIDEAYVDFSGRDALELLKEFDNVVITRTFSKSYSLAGLRFGFVLGAADVITQLEKIRDSYNINRLTQVAAEAAFYATDYYRDCIGRIIADREFLRTELLERGFVVPNSAGNFVFARCTGAEKLYQELKSQKVLIRYFKARGLEDGMRISIGTHAEIVALLKKIDDIYQR
jgi:histidinol-phosphate aminotransferase